MEKITMDSNKAEGVWDLFNAIGSGWNISSGRDCICFDPTDQNDMKASYSFARDLFDVFKDLSLVDPLDEKHYNPKETVAESLGSIFTISDKGKELYIDISNVDESQRKSKFYELTGIEVL